MEHALFRQISERVRLDELADLLGRARAGDELAALRDAYAHAVKLQKTRRATFIHPYDDPDVIAGQGSIAVELIRDLENFDTVIVPIGGGGLISGTPAIGLLFCFAMFIGFEATTIYSEEAKDPHRTIPLATYLSVLLIGGFYAFSVWCMVVGAGADSIVKAISTLQDPTTFLYALSDRYANKSLTLAMSVLFITSVYAGLLAFHNSAARYFFASGREGLLSKALGRTHPVHQSPHNGSLLQSALAAVVVLGFVVAKADPVLTLFSWLTNIATLCVIALMALTTLAVIRYFKYGNPGAPEGTLRVFVLPLLSGIALCAVLLLSCVAMLGGARGESAIAEWAAARAEYVRSVKTALGTPASAARSNAGTPA